MSYGCQVIKANGRWCCNYARKDMTCCWSHRNLENDVPEKEPEKEPKKKCINGARQIALRRAIAEKNQLEYDLLTVQDLD